MQLPDIEVTAKLDRLWKFVESEHFNEIYEEIIKREAFVDTIKNDPPKMTLNSPFLTYAHNFVEISADTCGTQGNLTTLIASVKDLVESLEQGLDPHSNISPATLHGRLLTVKQQLQYIY